MTVEPYRPIRYMGLTFVFNSFMASLRYDAVCLLSVSHVTRHFPFIAFSKSLIDGFSSQFQNICSGSMLSM